MDTIAIGSFAQAGTPARTSTTESLGTHKAHRIAGLDGLRTVAVSVVFIGHYIEAIVPGTPWLAKAFPGMLGVSLFFVVSGFLISGLLFNEFSEKGSLHIGHFYARRFLRLTPALYAYVAITFMAYYICDGHVRYWDFVSALTYSSNYYQIYASSYMYYMPVWSLAIEEHFYLLFPISMLFLMRKSPRALTKAVVLTIFVIFCWRLVVAAADGANFKHIYWRTDTRLDSILFGVFLTCVAAAPNTDRLKKFVGCRNALLLGVALLLVSTVYRDEYFRMTVRYTLQGISLMSLVGYIVFSKEKLGRTIRGALELKPVVYISKISYSLYLWHLTILMFTRHLLSSMTPVLAILCAVASFGLAALSYHYLEIPFLRLRRKFGSHATA